MTNQEVYDYIKENVSEHTNTDGNDYFADIYVKDGYGQIRGGYFDEVYKQNKKICKVEAEPSQKWHLLNAYFDTKKENVKFNMKDKANLGRIMCPQLMIWIAEVAGLNRNDLETAMNEVIIYEKTNQTKDSRKIKTKVLKKALHWERIMNYIKNENTWEDVRAKVCSEFK